MKQIDPQRLYDVLSKDRLRNWRFLIKLMELTLPPKYSCDKYEGPFANDNETCFSIVYHDAFGTNVYFSDYDPEFVSAFDPAFVYKKTASLSTSQNFFGLRFFLPPEQKMPVATIYDMPIGSYSYMIYAGKAPDAPIGPNIRILEKNELDFLDPYVPYTGDYPGADIDARLAKVKEKGGKIFAWFEGEQMKTCIGCISVFEEFFDIELHYTDCNSQEIRTSLLYAYLKTIREQGGIPTYSGRYWETAQKAGFQQYQSFFIDKNIRKDLTP